MMWYLNDVVKSKGIEFRCLSLAWKFSVSIFLNKVLSLWLFSFWNSSVCRLVNLAAPLNPSAGFTRRSFSPDLSPSLLVLPSAWKSLLLKVLVHFLVQSYSLATDFQFACDFCPSVKWLTLFLPCFLCQLLVNSCSLFTQLPWNNYFEPFVQASISLGYVTRTFMTFLWSCRVSLIFSLFPLPSYVAIFTQFCWLASGESFPRVF